MHDDFMTPIWADRHGEVSAFLRSLLRQTWTAFERLAARTYDAPWKQWQSPRHSPMRQSAPGRGACPPEPRRRQHPLS